VLSIDSPGCNLSLGKSVAAAGGIKKWNEHPNIKALLKTLDASCKATTVDEALAEVRGLMSLGHNLWAFAYLKVLQYKDLDLCYRMLLAEPALLLPVAYTPTVGEACQKYGLLPQVPRGCYVCIEDRGNLKAVVEEYASQHLSKGPDGKYMCDCIVFSDGGRILGLGDLGVWGMGIPAGKLDLYTVCGGFDPRKTIPLIIDAGCNNAAVREHELYTGLKKERVKVRSAAGTDVNAAYYGEGNMIEEFMTAATDLFGKGCLLQFEDFNSNDAFPLLAEYRNKFLTYNDDIQGTAAVAVAAVLGGIKIQMPNETNLIGKMRELKYLFVGAGSANLGAASLIAQEGGVPVSSITVTNSKGVIWRSEDGKEGTFKNDEQKGVAQIGQPDFPCGAGDLVCIIKNLKPDVIIGATGVAPGSFTKEVIEAMLEVQAAKPTPLRPIVFALSNPKTQAEIVAADCYKFSGGKCIYGSGTRFPSETVDGKLREPGQVNNFFIFPGMSFGAVQCGATSIPEKFFMAAAEAVANSLDAHDIDVESVVPNPERIRDVNHNVAIACVLEAQAAGLASKTLGKDAASVSAALKAAMWVPAGSAPAKPMPPPPNGRKMSRRPSNYGSEAESAVVPLPDH